MFSLFILLLMPCDFYINPKKCLNSKRDGRVCSANIYAHAKNMGNGNRERNKCTID